MNFISRKVQLWAALVLVLLALAGLTAWPLMRLVRRPALDHRSAQVAPLLAHRHYEEALALLQEIAPERAGPEEQVRLAFQQAFCERALGRPEQARDRLEKLQGALPLLEEYRRFWVARCLEEMGSLPQAAAAYEELLGDLRQPALLDSVTLRLISLYRGSGEHARALELAGQLQERSPARAAEALYQMGLVCAATPDPGKAQELQLRLMEEYPGHPRALEVASQSLTAPTPRLAYARAQVFFRQKQYPEAGQAAQRFLRAFPGHPLTGQAALLLAQLDLAQRQYERARQAFARVYRRYRLPEALYGLGDAQVRGDRDPQAIATYQRFVRLYPRHDLADQALWKAARAQERCNGFATAALLYAQVAQHYPSSEYRDEALWATGFMEYCQHRYPQALDRFQQAARQATAPHLVDQSLFWAGKAAERAQQSEEAAGYYREAAGGFPRSYYSTHALDLGYGSQVPRPAAPPVARDGQPLPAWAGRAELLCRLGLASLAREEVEQAGTLQGETELRALRAIRDRCEALGLGELALILSARIAERDNSPEELVHLYPRPYWDLVAGAAGEAEIDPELVLAVIRQESFFQEDAVSPVGAMGLMQLMPETGQVLAGELGLADFSTRQLLEPAVSVRLGARYLAAQMRAFADAGPQASVALALAAYNAGPQAARQWQQRFSAADLDVLVERIPYQETRLYVKKVLRNYAVYKAMSRPA